MLTLKTRHEDSEYGITEVWEDDYHKYKISVLNPTYGDEVELNIITGDNVVTDIWYDTYEQCMEEIKHNANKLFFTNVLTCNMEDIIYNMWCSNSRLTDADVTLRVLPIGNELYASHFHDAAGEVLYTFRNYIMENEDALIVGKVGDREIHFIDKEWTIVGENKFAMAN